MIDREKASAFGVTFEDINNTISTNLGSAYINDFPNRGRMQRVIVQSDKPNRMNRGRHPGTTMSRTAAGQLVPFSAFATIEWSKGPTQIVGFNYYPSVRISGEAKPGLYQRRRDRRDGAACRPAAARLRLRMDRPVVAGEALGLAGAVPARAVGPGGLPLPGGALRELDDSARGAAHHAARHLRRSAAANLRGLSNDVYFTVGLITIIGLAAKDAILIIEFAKDLRAQGKPLVEATLEACKLRFRPILMTGLAFVCGVLPMAIATAPAARASRRSAPVSWAA
jgi:multidrug efflux pump